MTHIEIAGKKIDLMYNTKAMIGLSKRCGGNLEDLAAWLDGKNSTETVEKYSQLICELANGAIFRHNKEVEFGLVDGEKQKFYDDDFFLAMIEPHMLPDFQNAVFGAISGGTDFTVPDGMKVQEHDIDLEEIEKERKN